MATFASLYPLIRLYIKNAPEKTMDIAIRHAAREFCRTSWWLRRSITVQLMAGVGYYTLEPPSDEEEIIGVIAVQDDNGRIIYPATQQIVRQEEGDPCNYIYLPTDTLEAVPSPKATAVDLQAWIVELATQPTAITETLAADLIRHYDHAVSDGAIAYLADMPSEGWSNDKVAAERERKFGNKTMSAKSEAMFGKTGWNATIELNRFDI